ncbi:MAG TPA: dolichyl-phosphate beta-glucosyltransferase [Verrucomicrobiae bacterium]|nr:dolichyl-phosphate beta-glucosyltransferase [Verrucomicrobiae bacterium]
MRVPDPSLLLLIPAYNEERRIEPVLRDYACFFQEQYHGKFQIVVVLNGCTDNTLGVVQRVAKEFSSVSYLNFPGRIGKGGALIEGLKLAPFADLIGYTDADGATPPPAFLELVRHTGEADCVIGSRWLPGAVIHQSQAGNRRFASRTFHLIVQLLFWLNIRDTQCGAKVMKRRAVEKIHPYLRIADMAFDINLLVALKRGGFRILEVPTEWTDQSGSKVVLGQTSLTMFLSAVRVRLIYWPWLYKLLRPLRPLEGWIYKSLQAPQPLSESQVQSPKSDVP